MTSAVDPIMDESQEEFRNLKVKLKRLSNYMIDALSLEDYDIKVVVSEKLEPSLYGCNKLCYVAKDSVITLFAQSCEYDFDTMAQTLIHELLHIPIDRLFPNYDEGSVIYNEREKLIDQLADGYMVLLNDLLKEDQSDSDSAESE